MWAVCAMRGVHVATRRQCLAEEACAEHEGLEGEGRGLLPAITIGSPQAAPRQESVELAGSRYHRRGSRRCAIVFLYTAGQGREAAAAIGWDALEP